MAVECGQKFIDNICLRLHYIPEVVVTDRGTEFDNIFMRTILESWNIKPRLLTAANAKANLAERCHDGWRRHWRH